MNPKFICMETRMLIERETRQMETNELCAVKWVPQIASVRSDYGTLSRARSSSSPNHQSEFVVNIRKSYSVVFVNRTQISHPIPIETNDLKCNKCSTKVKCCFLPWTYCIAHGSPIKHHPIWGGGHRRESVLCRYVPHGSWAAVFIVAAEELRSERRGM